MLKDYLQSQLPNPGITSTCDASEGAGIYAAARVIKIRAIEYVKELRPKLNLVAFAEGKVLEKSHVPRHQTRPDQSVLAYVPKRAYRRKRERLTIQKINARSLAAACPLPVRRTHDHGTILANGRLGLILPRHDCKRKTGLSAKQAGKFPTPE